MTPARKFQNIIEQIESEIRSIDSALGDPYARYEDSYLDRMSARREAYEEVLVLIFEEFNGELNAASKSSMPGRDSTT